MVRSRPCTGRVSTTAPLVGRGLDCWEPPDHGSTQYHSTVGGPLQHPPGEPSGSRCLRTVAIFTVPPGMILITGVAFCCAQSVMSAAWQMQEVDCEGSLRHVLPAGLVSMGWVGEEHTRPVVRRREVDRSDPSRLQRGKIPDRWKFRQGNLEKPTALPLCRLRKPRGNCLIREVRLQTHVPSADLVPGSHRLGAKACTGPGRSLGDAQLRGCLRFAGGVATMCSPRLLEPLGRTRETKKSGWWLKGVWEAREGILVHLRFRPCARLPSGSTLSVVDA